MAGEPKAQKVNPRVVLALAASVVAFAAVFFISQHGATGGGAQNTVPVVEASADLIAGTQLTDSNLAIANVPADQAPADAFHNFSGVSGQFLSIAVTAKTPILQSILIHDPAAQANVLTQQPLTIDKGDLALAIPTSAGVGAGDLTSVGYYIQAGDHIDIVVGSPAGVHFGFQDVAVLRVGDRGATAAGTPSVLIIELPRAQAEQMEFILAQKTLGGTPAATIISYTLRPHAEYGTGAESSGTADPNLGKSVNDPPVSPQSFSAIFH